MLRVAVPQPIRARIISSRFPVSKFLCGYRGQGRQMQFSSGLSVVFGKKRSRTGVWNIVHYSYIQILEESISNS